MDGRLHSLLERLTQGTGSSFIKRTGLTEKIEHFESRIEKKVKKQSTIESLRSWFDSGYVL